MNSIALKIEGKMRQSKRIIHLRVRELARERKLSDLELAHLAQVQVTVIRRMFAQQKVGGLLLSQLMRVADALNVDVCDLIQSKDTKDGNSHQ
jgi:DNA-binding Xre family transcriptional regulator